jgi:hypothetical protein
LVHSGTWARPLTKAKDPQQKELSDVRSVSSMWAKLELKEAGREI